MPRIRRWLHVSQDINADPEVWLMRHTIGEKSLSIWIEILSISDRNESELPGDYQELIRSIAGRCQATTRTVSAVFEFAKTHLWLVLDPTLRVRNYAKYNPSRDANKIPNGNLTASPPILPILPILPIPTNKDISCAETSSFAPAAVNQNGRRSMPADAPSYSDMFEGFWDLYPKKTGKGAAWKLWQKMKLEGLGMDIGGRVFLACEELEQWQKDRGQFIPLPATYLSQRRWEDELPGDKERERKQAALLAKRENG